MALPNIKELRDLIKMLRSQGVLQFNSPDISLVLTEQPPASKLSKIEQADEVEELTPEEEAERILFYSVPSPAETQSE